MEFNVEDIKNALLIKYPYFGSILANARIIESEEIKTAETDGIDIYYNRKFMNQQNKKQQLFTLAHEISHICLNHIERGRDKNHEVFNFAADAVINAHLEKDGLTPPLGVIHDENAIFYTAEEYYEKLMKENPKIGKNGLDSHQLWGEHKSTSKKNSTFQKEEEISEVEFFSKNRVERGNKIRNLKKELIKKSIGLEEANNKRKMENIGNSTSFINWQDFLQASTRKEEDWSYLHSSIEDGIIRPLLEEELKEETEIVLDTSGSVDDTLLRNFLRECKNILQTSTVKVGCFDTKFYGFQQVRTEEDIDQLVFDGGGGTDFEVAVSAFSETADNKIIFTDGKSSMPKKKVDAIWIVFSNEKISPPDGKVIYISEEELSKLSIYFKTKENSVKSL